MSDLSAYGSSIQALREQAQSCRVSVALVSAVMSDLGGGRESRRTQTLPAGVVVTGDILVTLAGLTAQRFRDSLKQVFVSFF